MTPKQIEKLKAIGWCNLTGVHGICKSGYAGISEDGLIVDRREHPDAIPIPEYEFLNIPNPKPWPSNDVGEVFCDNCGRPFVFKSGVAKCEICGVKD